MVYWLRRCAGPVVPSRVTDPRDMEPIGLEIEVVEKPEPAQNVFKTVLNPNLSYQKKKT